MPESKTRTCTWNGCTRPLKGHGLCELHRTRRQRGTDMDAPLHPRVRLEPAPGKTYVQLGITLPPEMIPDIDDVVGHAYGARAKWVRELIVNALQNRGEMHWKRKYQEEATRRRVLEQRLNEIRTILS